MADKCKKCGYRHTKLFFTRCCSADIVTYESGIDTCSKCKKVIKDNIEIMQCWGMQNE
ncbi:MAG: hypothetical protein GTO02_13505 [Candidatus Dadabacteria bacterium]|nr:hypothetical protein [Candidatus Dadabacteria bacterium]